MYVCSYIGVYLRRLANFTNVVCCTKHFETLLASLRVTRFETITIMYTHYTLVTDNERNALLSLTENARVKFQAP